MLTFSPASTPILPSVTYLPDFLGEGEALRLYNLLLSELEFKAETYEFNGVQVTTKRKVAYHSEHSYSYSGQTYQGKPWTPTLTLLRQMVKEKTGHDFNAVLCNFYPEGSATMGWHTDSEKELGPDPVIASVSFGQKRTFAFRPKRSKSQKKPTQVCEYQLGGGDLLVMEKGTQPFFEHALLADKSAIEARMNLTFRQMLVP